MSGKGYRCTRSIRTKLLRGSSVSIGGDEGLSAADGQIEVLDLRHFAAKQLRGLLEEESRVWAERLDWVPAVLASLDRPFLIERPDELRDLIAALAARLAAAANGRPLGGAAPRGDS